MSQPSPAAPDLAAAPPVTSRRSLHGTLLVLLSATAFGLMALFARRAYAEGVSVLLLLTLRFSIASLALWAVLLWQRRPLALPRPTLAGLLLMGGVGYVGQSFGYFTALTRIPAATVAMLLYTFPAIVMVLSFLLGRERPTLARLGALACALLGCLLVLGAPRAAGDPLGVALALLAAAVYACFILAGAHFTAGQPPLLTSAYILTAAAAVYLAITTLAGDLRLDLTLAAWGAVLATALVSTVLPLTTMFAGIARIGPSRAAIVSTAEPVVTAVGAALLLGEPIGPLQALGAACILGAVVWLQLADRHPTSAREAML